MKSPRISFFSASVWAYAACGFLTALGNVLGLASNQTPVFPPVDNLGALLSTSLLLVAVGLIPPFIHTLRKRSA